MRSFEGARSAGGWSVVDCVLAICLTVTSGSLSGGSGGVPV